MRSSWGEDVDALLLFSLSPFNDKFVEF